MTNSHGLVYKERAAGYRYKGAETSPRTKSKHREVVGWGNRNKLPAQLGRPSSKPGVDQVQRDWLEVVHLCVAVGCRWPYSTFLVHDHNERRLHRPVQLAGKLSTKGGPATHTRTRHKTNPRGEEHLTHPLDHSSCKRDWRAGSSSLPRSSDSRASYVLKASSMLVRHSCRVHGSIASTANRKQGTGGKERLHKLRSNYKAAQEQSCCGHKPGTVGTW